MPLIKRNLAPWEYEGKNGKIMTSKKNLTPQEILAAKHKAYERQKKLLSRKAIELDVREDVVLAGEKATIKRITKGLKRLEVPWFTIRYAGEEAQLHGAYIGFIARGHRLVWSLENKGVFSKALKHLENYEKQRFHEGWFEKYKQIILDAIKEEGKLRTEDRKLIEGLNKPMHIDYTQSTSSACALLKNGYNPTPATMERLHLLGVPKGLSRVKLIKHIRNTDKIPEHTVYVFTKEAV